MPYLITPRRAQAATTADRMGLGVPGYAHPLVAPVEWAELTRPRTPLHWVVLNVSNGPGTRPDPHCLEAAGRIRNAMNGAARSASLGGGGRATGGRVLGRLDSAYGTRSLGVLVSDAHRFRDWYRVDGFYLDRCPSGRTHLADVRRVGAALSGMAEGGAHLVLGHGMHPYPGYAEVADQLVTFSGPWTDYRWSQVAEWTADYPPERFCHLVHGLPRTHLEEAVRIARWQGAGTVFMTDRTADSDHGGDYGGDHGGDHEGQTDPFETLPGYWDEIVSRIGPGVSE